MAYWDLSPKAAPGVDGVTWEDYGQDLAGNLRDLHDRVHSGRYQARPSRRAYIPKADGRLRPARPGRLDANYWRGLARGQTVQSGMGAVGCRGRP